MKSVIFMGSPEFALPSLSLLLENKNYNIKAVYTKPPKPSGRGHIINKTPIHLLAERNNIRVLTPVSLKDHDIEEIDVIVLVAYALMIPKHIIDLPKFGCINVHPSLLPRWRGASPIESAILAGDEYTGVSIMKMNEFLDAGDVFATTRVPILERNFEELHNELASLGAECLMSVLNNIDNINPTPQIEEGVTYAKKYSNTLIDWNNSSDRIKREIDAFMGKNFSLNGKLIKIKKASFKDINHGFNIGEIINTEFHIACSNGVLIPEIVQPAGKNSMAIKNFTNGIKDYINTILS